MAIQNTIPVVDISPFLDASSSAEQNDLVVKAVRDACITYGFFQLTGHGIPEEMQQKMLECSRLFFDLPLEQKQACAMAKAMGESGRGYERLGGQTLQAGALPDLKEGIYIGDEVSPDDPRAGRFLQGPNMWPAGLTSETFRAPVMEYRRRMISLGHLLLKILAMSLPFSGGALDVIMTEPVVGNVRLLHYPPQKDSLNEKQLGDFGVITLLLQDPTASGLQVLYPPTNSWIPVPAVRDTFVVNIGDLLQKWTCGHYRSATHRVLNVGGSHRYSVPFFYHGNVDTEIRPFDENGKVYDDLTFKVEDHIKGKFKDSYSTSQKKE
ncbi:UPF0676 protein [Coleophoma crateriformis]|uniref:UPF0676 protein n=1 Tax=Coleophoma crateriformis TaxID=565419 RepID=A0A3D8RVY7_9HELO|nr:UPF0676 protein [Coleophoma crateriformis]